MRVNLRFYFLFSINLLFQILSIHREVDLFFYMKVMFREKTLSELGWGVILDNYLTVGWGGV